jgi:hypothetical protein
MTSTHTNLRGLRTEAYANQLTGQAGGPRIGIGASTYRHRNRFLVDVQSNKHRRRAPRHHHPLPRVWG